MITKTSRAALLLATLVCVQPVRSQTGAFCTALSGVASCFATTPLILPSSQNVQPLPSASSWVLDGIQPVSQSFVKVDIISPTSLSVGRPDLYAVQVSSRYSFALVTGRLVLSARMPPNFQFVAAASNSACYLSTIDAEVIHCPVQGASNTLPYSPVITINLVLRPLPGAGGVPAALTAVVACDETTNIVCATPPIAAATKRGGAAPRTVLQASRIPQPASVLRLPTTAVQAPTTPNAVAFIPGAVGPITVTVMAGPGQKEPPPVNVTITRTK